jgi:pimeloyl-ACP methyl ester carboxylesterase
MAATTMVPSADVQIEVITHGSVTKKSPARLVAVACGGGTNVLDRLGWPVLEMQMRGYGKSTYGKVPSLSDHVGDIGAVTKHFKVQKTVLLGYSHGGYFTTAYALANPDKVSALVLVEPALFNSRDELQARVKVAKDSGAEAGMKSMLSQVQPSTGLNSAPASEIAKSLLKNVTNTDTMVNEFALRGDYPISEDHLSSLKMPVLLVGGSKSHAASTVSKLARILPSASVWWVRGAEHLDLMSPNVAPQLQPVVESFLAGL